MVMYGGKAVEGSSADRIFYEAEHPYTWGLLQSMPRIDSVKQERLRPIAGNPPSLINPPSGCAFHPRCTHKDKVKGNLCKTEMPELLPGNRGPEHTTRCHLADPEQIYFTEILPEIAPDLVEEFAEVNPDGSVGAEEPVRSSDAAAEAEEKKI